MVFYDGFELRICTLIGTAYVVPRPGAMASKRTLTLKYYTYIVALQLMFRASMAGSLRHMRRARPMDIILNLDTITLDV